MGVWKFVRVEVNFKSVNRQPSTLKRLQLFSNGSQKSSTQAAIDNPVIIAHRQIHHMAYTDGVSLISFNNDRTFFNCTDSQYGHLGLIDDGGAHQAAKHAYIGQCKSSFLYVLGFKFVV